MTGALTTYMARDSLDLGLRMVRRSPRVYPLTDDELRGRVATALALGVGVAAALRQRWPIEGAVDVARALGIAVSEEAGGDGEDGHDVRASHETAATGPPFRLAGFVRGRGISVYGSGRQQVAAAIGNLLSEMLEDYHGRRQSEGPSWVAPLRSAGGPVADPDVVATELLVAHELFHYLEERPPGVPLGPLASFRGRIARHLGYRARFFGIAFRAAVPELAEVAAHGFSTAFLKLPFSALLVHGRVSGWE